MGGEAGNIPLLEAELWLHPSISLLLTTFISFCSGIFCFIMQTSFWLLRLQEISIFDLNFFCSHCFCFLLFTKFLNTARISSLFHERTHLVCCSLQSHESLSWVLEPSYNFRLLYPSVLLWHISLKSLSMHGPVLTPEWFCAQPSLPCVGLMESVLGPCAPKLCTECAKQYSNPRLYAQFQHMHMMNWQTEMRIMKRTKPTVSRWVW